MLFKKKNKMVDLAELHKKGIGRPIQRGDVVAQNSDGFIEVGSVKSKKAVSNSSSGQFYDYLGTGSRSSSSSSGSFSTETDGYNKREVDAKIIALDNKIYKLEQRLALLERKAGVGGHADNSSVMDSLGF